MASAAPVAAVAVLSLSAVACGGSETSSNAAPPSAESTVADAVAETLDAGTAKLAITFEHTRFEPTFGVEPGERDVLEGAVDFAEHHVEIGTDTDTLILDESTYYFRDAGEPWKAYSRDPEQGDALPPDISLGRLDPIPLLEYVADIGSSLLPAGEEDVRGVATTRYQGDGQAEALMHALLSDSLFAGLTWESHSVSVERSEPVAFDVWVGEEGRVHKIVLDFPDFDSWLGDLTTVELHDFGADADIEIPEAEEAVE